MSITCDPFDLACVADRYQSELQESMPGEAPPLQEEPADSQPKPEFMASVIVPNGLALWGRSMPSSIPTGLLAETSVVTAEATAATATSAAVASTVEVSLADGATGFVAGLFGTSQLLKAAGGKASQHPAGQTDAVVAQPAPSSTTSSAAEIAGKTAKQDGLYAIWGRTPPEPPPTPNLDKEYDAPDEKIVVDVQYIIDTVREIEGGEDSPKPEPKN